MPKTFFLNSFLCFDVHFVLGFMLFAVYFMSFLDVLPSFLLDQSGVETAIQEYPILEQECTQSWVSFQLVLQNDVLPVYKSLLTKKKRPVCVARLNGFVTESSYLG